jgi:hypothetical protein
MCGVRRHCEQAFGSLAIQVMDRRSMHRVAMTLCGFALGFLAAPRHLQAKSPAFGKVIVSTTDRDSGGKLPFRLVLQRVVQRPMKASVRDSDGANEMELTLAHGRYRIIVFHGLEWTAAEREIVIDDQPQTLAIGLRHVIEPGLWIGADLHTHARGSFDSLMPYTKREDSLTAMGVEVAVSSDHDTASQPVAKGPLAWIGGVEITRNFGHLNLYPFTAAPPPKRYRRLRDLVAEAVDRAPEAILQVNHPRLQGMGLFTILRIKRGVPPTPEQVPLAVRHLEVFNGRDRQASVVRASVDEWLTMWQAGRPFWATGGSDVHKSVRPSPGFPRTYVPCLPFPTRKTCGTPLWLRTMLDGGRAFVTSGPFVEVRQNESGMGPGGALVVHDGQATIRVRVRAAPYVSADELVVLVGGKEMLRRQLPTKALRYDSAGTLAEARKAAIAFDDDVTVPVATDAKTLVVLVRGKQSMRTLIPTLDMEPFAFTNPLIVGPGPSR